MVQADQINREFLVFLFAAHIAVVRIDILGETVPFVVFGYLNESLVSLLGFIVENDI